MHKYTLPLQNNLSAAYNTGHRVAYVGFEVLTAAVMKSTVF
jgi:hypothetical protein